MRARSATGDVRPISIPPPWSSFWMAGSRSASSSRNIHSARSIRCSRLRMPAPSSAVPCSFQPRKELSMTAEAARVITAQKSEAKDHNLVVEAIRETVSKGVLYEKRPVKGADGKPVAGLFNAWITLDNQNQFNSYTTDMVKATILAFRAASTARDVVAVVFTGAGDKAFCTGGNTKEYAEYYAGNPQEYRAYMRLFNDMVTAILHCDRPVICRVNGIRVAGGQEIGMACDFSVASDLARFGQAGPKHGSAPDGGATDFLPLFTGIEHATVSCVLCRPWTAYEAQRIGLTTEVVP